MATWEITTLSANQRTELAREVNHREIIALSLSDRDPIRKKDMHGQVVTREEAVTLLVFLIIECLKCN